MSISGATQTCFKYLDLNTSLSIHFDPSFEPDILWAHYSYDQPIYQTKSLHTIDNIICVSNWQKQKFIDYLKIPEHKLKVIRNGGAEVFNYNNTPKSKTFIYTSTPFRGLEYIPSIWKLIIEKHPDAKLKVFSSMKLYGMDDSSDYNKLFDEIKNLPNATHYYPVEHAELAKHLEDAAYFLYPNTWEETSCVSLIEAMSSGCIPIISNIGALPETSNGFGYTIAMKGINTTKGWIPENTVIENFADTAIRLLDDFNPRDSSYTIISNFATKYYDWNKIRIEWYDYIKEIRTMNDSTQIQPVKFEEAITDDYIDKTKEFALRWFEQDRELCQTTSNFQIERFIAMNYDTISHAFENILRNRKAAALNLFNKSIEMTEKQREFDMKWKDVPKDQPIQWEMENGNKKWIWYDLDARHHEIYMIESENSIRDLCYQLETYDKILEELERKNGGPVTRQQFNEEAPENWNRRFQTKMFDDMVSKYTGVSPNVFDSFRAAISDGVVDGLNGKPDVSALPSIDKSISDPIEFMTALSKTVEAKMHLYKPTGEMINRPMETQKLEDWFNNDDKPT